MSVPSLAPADLAAVQALADADLACAAADHPGIRIGDHDRDVQALVSGALRTALTALLGEGPAFQVYLRVGAAPNPVSVEDALAAVFAEAR